MKPAQQRRRILIAGLGNVLMMDDGVGVHAVRELQKDPPLNVCIAEVGTAVLRAIHLIEQANKIIAIDAVKIGGPPGTIYAFSAESAENQGHQVSLHELNLLGALRFLPPGHPRPAIVILGVEPQVIDYGLYLSEAVQAVLSQVVQAAREIVAGWERNPDTWSVAELEEAAKSGADDRTSAQT